MPAMIEIDSRRWVRTPGEVPLFDGVALWLAESAERGFKVAARVRVQRNGALLAEVGTGDIGSLWLPGRLRRGLELRASFGDLSIRRNGPRLLRSQRMISIQSERDSWTLRGLSRGFEFAGASGLLLWSRSSRSELLDTDQPAESLALVGLLAYANVQAALAAVPALSRC